jgi:hypothetical protein
MQLWELSVIKHTASLLTDCCSCQTHQPVTAIAQFTPSLAASPAANLRVLVQLAQEGLSTLVLANLGWKCGSSDVQMAAAACVRRSTT